MAGLLRGLWNAVDPYLPDEQIMGLLGRRSQPQGLLGGGDYMRDYAVNAHGVDPGLMPAPAPAPEQYDATTDGKPGFWGVLDQVLGGRTITDAREAIRQRELDRRLEPLRLEARQGQAQATADVYRNAGDLTPEQRMALGLNREALGAALAEGSKPRQTKIKEIRGHAIDENDPDNVGRYFPELPEGTIPLYDGQGNITHIQGIDGSVEAVAKREGAVTAARAAAEAQYDIIEIPLPNGQTMRLPRSVALQALGGGAPPAPQPAPGTPGSPTAAPPTLPQGLGLSQNPAEAARQKALAEAQAKAEADLPNVIQTAEETLKLIHGLRDHPGRRRGTGLDGVIPPLPGSPTYDFVTMLKQAQGKAFLEAISTLKGSGQITEVEGQKATDAIARLDRAQSEEGFLQALADLESIINGAVTRARQRAGQGSPRAAGPTTQGKGYRILSVE